MIGVEEDDEAGERDVIEPLYTNRSSAVKF